MVRWGGDQGDLGATGARDGGEAGGEEGCGGVEFFWAGVEADRLESRDCGGEVDYFVAGFGVETGEGRRAGGVAKDCSEMVGCFGEEGVILLRL